MTRPLRILISSIATSLFALSVGIASVIFEVSRHTKITSHIAHSAVIGVAVLFCILSLLALVFEFIKISSDLVSRYKFISLVSAFYLAWFFYFIVFCALGCIGLAIGVAKIYFETGNLPIAEVIPMMLGRSSTMTVVISAIPATIMFVATALGFDVSKNTKPQR